jgi:hypothetical protein
VRIYVGGEDQWASGKRILAVLLGVHATTLNRAEGSESPSPGLIYGVELLRKQILQKEFDLDEFRKSRDRTLPRKKKN